MQYDTIIIGAGIVGCSVARYLSQYEGRFLVLEKEEDVCCGTSKANSAIVHAGFDAQNGSLMAKYNVRGSRMYPELAGELDFPYSGNGSLVLAFSQEEKERLEQLRENGIANGVEGLEIIGREQLLAMEPNVSEDAVAALYAPTGGIVCPFQATVAMAENAAVNGTAFRFDTAVQKIQKSGEGWQVLAGDGEVYETRTVVNAAGVYADVFHNMVSSEKIEITPRRGEYCLMDKGAGGFVKHTIFRVPGRMGKGVLVTPTVHGNLLVGPTAADIADREGTNTTAEGLQKVLESAGKMTRNLPAGSVITSFAGLRAHEGSHDFVLGEPAEARGFYDCAGIESPGLSAAPAIGLDIAEQIASGLQLNRKKEFVRERKGFLNPLSLPDEEYAELIQEKPAYGQIICRCESITEGQILDAVRRPVGARSLDGIKRRVRAGMGRCQGGFCSPRVMEILAQEMHTGLEEITKCGGNSKVVAEVME